MMAFLAFLARAVPLLWRAIRQAVVLIALILVVRAILGAWLSPCAASSGLGGVYSQSHSLLSTNREVISRPFPRQINGNPSPAGSFCSWLLIADLAAGFAQGVHQFLECLAFKLANPLAGQTEVLADLAQSHGL